MKSQIINKFDTYKLFILTKTFKNKKAQNNCRKDYKENDRRNENS